MRRREYHSGRKARTPHYRRAPAGRLVLLRPALVVKRQWKIATGCLHGLSCYGRIVRNDDCDRHKDRRSQAVTLHAQHAASLAAVDDLVILQVELRTKLGRTVTDDGDTIVQEGKSIAVNNILESVGNLLVDSCLSGCFSTPHYVVYGPGAPFVSEESARVPAPIRDRGRLSGLLGGLSLA